MKAAERNDYVMGTEAVTDKDDLMIITDKGQVIRIKMKEIRSMGRATQGVRLINISSEKVVSIEHLAEKEEDSQDGDHGTNPSSSDSNSPATAGSESENT